MFLIFFGDKALKRLCKKAWLWLIFLEKIVENYFLLHLLLSSVLSVKAHRACIRRQVYSWFYPLPGKICCLKSSPQACLVYGLNVKRPSSIPSKPFCNYQDCRFLKILRDDCDTWASHVRVVLIPQKRPMEALASSAAIRRAVASFAGVSSLLSILSLDSAKCWCVGDFARIWNPPAVCVTGLPLLSGA